MIARVFGVIRRSTAAGSRLYVLGPRSAKTGTACWYNAPMTVPMSVIGLVMTSSPGPMPAAAVAMCTAAVPDEQGMTCVSGQTRRNRSVSAAVCGPFQ